MKRGGIIRHVNMLRKRVPSALINGIIGVKYHFPSTITWNPEAVVGNGRTRQVAHSEQGRPVRAIADLTQHVIVRVIGLDPLEAVLAKILAPQSWGVAVNEVDIAHEALNAPVPLLSLIHI